MWWLVELLLTAFDNERRDLGSSSELTCSWNFVAGCVFGDMCGIMHSVFGLG